MTETSHTTEPSYILGPDEKSTRVMIGTADTLIWGDLVTKEQVRMSAYLNTLAEGYVPMHDAKILFLAPEKQAAPIHRASVHIRQEEILIFFAMNDQEPLPEETETRRYEAVEAIIGPYQIAGSIVKAPISSLQNALLVSKATYTLIYNATLHHVAKPWLGSFASSLVQARSERMILTVE